MVPVNFLPWREHYWRRQKFRWLWIFFSVLVGMLLLITLTEYRFKAAAVRLAQAEQAQQAVLALVAAGETRQHDLMQEVIQLNMRQKQIQQHQQNMQRWQAFWQRLGTLLPDELWLSTLEKAENRLVISGISRSVRAVNHLQKALSQQSLFVTVHHGQMIRQKEGTYSFTLAADIAEVQYE